MFATAEPSPSTLLVLSLFLSVYLSFFCVMWPRMASYLLCGCLFPLPNSRTVDVFHNVWLPILVSKYYFKLTGTIILWRIDRLQRLPRESTRELGTYCSNTQKKHVYIVERQTCPKNTEGNPRPWPNLNNLNNKVIVTMVRSYNVSWTLCIHTNINNWKDEWDGKAHSIT